MRKLTLFCILALVVAIAVPAYAAVQNVKVSGDITVRGFIRDYSVSGSGGARTDLLNDDPSTLTSARFLKDRESRDNYTTCTRVRIDADLTDNVATTVRLLNERDWDGGSTSTASTDDVDLDLAYITLKEMLYSPLTMVIGRQDIKLGSGLILGDGVIGETTPTPNDYSARKAFDAILAALDYDPLTVYVGTGKLVEAAQSTTTDDVDAYFVDAVYNFGDYNAVLDCYYLLAHYNSPNVGGPSTTWDLWADNTIDSNKAVDVNVIGARLTGEPVENLTGELEFAYQFGDYVQSTTTNASRDLKAWATTVGATYAFQTDYSPTLGVKYDYRSGQKATDGTPTGDYEAWLPLYEDQKLGEILDPNTNVHAINLNSSIKPMEDLTAKLDYYHYLLAEKPSATNCSRKAKTSGGDEIDINLIYNYTEDVTFGLLGAYFMPGGSFEKNYDDEAMEVVGSVAVVF